MINHDSGNTTSIWMAAPGAPLTIPLTEHLTVDVCVIGAGIAGLTTAYMLCREGRLVAVLDDGQIGGGETSRTTAHLVNALDRRYSDLESLHGESGARRAAGSHTAAIDRIETIAAAEKINCDFERLDGYLFVPPGESTAVLDKELDAAHRAGLTQVTRVARAPITSFETGPCLRFPRQAQFHPLKYLYGLARAIQSRGGKIFTGTHAEKIEAGPPGQVTTSRGPIVRSTSIIVATNSPVNDIVRVHTKQAAYRSYVIGARVPKGSVTTALYWDTADPFHYVRLQKEGDHEVLIVGGEDHKTGQADDASDRFNRLEQWMRQRFARAGTTEYRWSGQVMESIDGLAFIGSNSALEPNIYIATGDSGNGMTHGTIAGILLTDLIQGRENEWKTLYDPARIRFGAVAEFAKENLNVMVQYSGGYVSGGEHRSAEEIGPGEGAIIQKGLSKVAVSRDAKGVLHEMSAVCPHLGCIVDWNSTEKTWDCPCHGSRFDASGKVVNGPAITGLEHVPARTD
jgi:glycine/D-amino acid oxidase-like deaminating enzyme/nitrite reductase/ring-hydroxylating ferredoxin subunit